MLTTIKYAELVANAMKSQKDAQPLFDYLREKRLLNDAIEAEVKRCRREHPGRPRYQIEQYITEHYLELKGELNHADHD